MKVVLIVTLMLLGQDKPAQHMGEMANLQACEAEAHEFMTHEFPKELDARISFKSAACLMAFNPGQPT